jgi:HAE1 family hydrophobic/amphiphilic exporter-1
VPSAFISGISGLFFRQFAVTISASTVISCFVSLTLSPALCAILLLPHQAHSTVPHRFLLARPVAGFFAGFNRGFEWLSNRFGQLTSRLIRVSVVVLIAYCSAPHCFVGLWSKYLVGKEVFGHAVSWVGDT